MSVCTSIFTYLLLDSILCPPNSAARNQRGIIKDIRDGTFEYDSKRPVKTNWTQYDPAQIYEMANYMDNMVMFRRHNNGLESSHRRTRKAIRERTDRSEINQEMEQFGDLLAILSNLWNTAYQKEILHDVEDLGYSLGLLIKDLPRLRKEYRKPRKSSEIPIADEKWMDILEDFYTSFGIN